MACNDCEDCLELIGITCYGTLEVIAGLTPSTAYYVWIEDKHGAFLVESYTTDLNGNLLIDTVEEGKYHAFSGNYKLTISTSPIEQTLETITVGYDTYTCIQMHFIDVD
jgi:hypothetical protein